MGLRNDLVQCSRLGTRGLKARRTARGVILMLTVICTLFCARAVPACTSITLKGADGTPVVARTNEWGAFDVKSQLMIVPRGHKLVSSTPDGKPGLTYTAKFGLVGIDALDQMFLAEGMNEEGLVVGFFYLPDFTEYMPYDPAKAAQSMGPLEVVLYLLSQFKSVNEVRAGLADIRVVPVKMDALGFPPPMHYRVADRTGKELVIEYTTGGQPDLYDAPLGVVTNAPTYDWHLTNLRNYIMLTREAKPELKVAGYTLGPLGAGSGQLGMPGDTTPPSRFIQAVVFTQLARQTKGGLDTVNEVFRILDHFNLATPGAEGADLSMDQQLPSATQWTAASDAKNRVFYWHTCWNRRVRMFDLKKIDFRRVRFQRIPLDRDRKQDIEEFHAK